MTTLPLNVVGASAVPLDEDRLAWLALALSPGLGPKRILDAVAQLDAPGQIFALPLTALEGMRFPAEAAQFIFDGKARQAAEEEWARVEAQGATLVGFSSLEYPERLKEIYDPPPVLWVRGETRLLSRPAIAIVGTRHPSPLYVAFRGVRISSRLGGKAVRPLGQHELSLSRRSATAPLFARRGESKAFGACMFKVGAIRSSVRSGWGGSRDHPNPEGGL